MFVCYFYSVYVLDSLKENLHKQEVNNIKIFVNAISQQSTKLVPQTVKVNIT